MFKDVKLLKVILYKKKIYASDYHLNGSSRI